MSTEENKRAIRDAFEIILNQKQLSRVSEFYAPNFIRHEIGQLFPTLRGCEETTNHIERLFIGIPDLYFELNEVIGDGDLVAARYTARGTHKGLLLGAEPTGKSLTWCGMNMYRLEQGKLVETWQLWDTIGLLQQLGVAIDIWRNPDSIQLDP